MAAEQDLLASRLNRRIIFQKKDKIRQSDGSYAYIWNDAFSTWAEVIAIGGEEGRMAAADSGITRYRITVRWQWLKKIDASMRIKTEFSEFINIVSNPRDPSGRKIKIEINGETKEGSV